MSLLSTGSGAPRLGQGPYWEEISPGQRFQTFRRTIREADLVNFISVTGMFEEIFIDASHGGAMGSGAVPSALTLGLIEGMLMQTLIQGTGKALLEMQMKTHEPVRIGDTIWAEVEVTDVRPTSKSGRAVVASNVTIYNQCGSAVITYAVKRLIAGRPNK
jgi:acyl dehydratase